jgi:pyruvate/2-oxoacid:ferredoxin oxidoreductase beta subunit
MVLMFLTEVALETGWWTLKQTYNLGHYMVYGEQESKEDKILRQVEELRKELEKEREELKSMKEEAYLNKRRKYNEDKMEPMEESENIYKKLLDDKLLSDDEEE